MAQVFHMCIHVSNGDPLSCQVTSNAMHLLHSARKTPPPLLGPAHSPAAAAVAAAPDDARRSKPEAPSLPAKPEQEALVAQESAAEEVT
jgi:hypothetical protein